MKTILFLFLITAQLAAHAQYVTVDRDGNIITNDSSGISSRYGGTFDEKAFKQFDHYANYTKGQMGFCPNFDHLPKVLDGILYVIQSNVLKKQDVVITLDTTGSMGDEIVAVKTNLVRLVNKLNANQSGKDIEVSIVLYKDQNQSDPYAAKLLIDLTQELQEIEVRLKKYQFLVEEIILK